MFTGWDMQGELMDFVVGNLSQETGLWGFVLIYLEHSRGALIDPLPTTSNNTCTETSAMFIGSSRFPIFETR